MYQKPKGTRDYFEQDAEWLQFLNDTLTLVAKFFNFKYIETPIVEHANVFQRSIGDASDIVQKEMYVFADKKGRQLALRPEGTAGVIRAVAEHKLFLSAESYQKLYYAGPMFRYERPQKGRQRQFYQFGAELIGPKSLETDLEIILFAHSILKYFNVDNQVVLQLNYLGGVPTQTNYKKELYTFFTRLKSQLSKNSQARLETNVLRILDSKDPEDQAFIGQAPKIAKFYSAKERDYFQSLQEHLRKIGIISEVNPRLVRGLDYYCDTIFEYVTKSEDAGPSGTILGGGRYDNLMREFGNLDVSGIGFSIGLERLLLEVQKTNEYKDIKPTLDVFINCLDDKSLFVGQSIAYILRNSGFSTEFNFTSEKIHKIFKLTNKFAPKFLIVIGEKDLKNTVVKIKNQESGTESVVKIDDLIDFMEKNIY